MLRGFRKALKRAFTISRLETGKHHWSIERWRSQTEKFLKNSLNMADISEKKLMAVILILYPSFGPSARKPADQEVYRVLGDEGI